MTKWWGRALPSGIASFPRENHLTMRRVRICQSVWWRSCVWRIGVKYGNRCEHGGRPEDWNAPEGAFDQSGYLEVRLVRGNRRGAGSSAVVFDRGRSIGDG